MSGDRRNSSSSFVSILLTDTTLSTDPTPTPSRSLAGTLKSDQEERVDDPSTKTGMAAVPPPPLGAKLTIYKLLNMAAMVVISTEKGVLTYKGLTIGPTTLDLISALVGVLLYWIGQYEGVKKGGWFFEFDLARPIVDCVKCVVVEVIGVVFFHSSLFITISVGNFLGNWAVLLLVRSYYHHWHAHGAARLAVYFGVIGFALVLRYLVNALIRRVRAPVPGQESESKCVMRSIMDAIMSAIRPGPAIQRRGRLSVRTMVKSFCGVSLVGLSFVAYLYLAWDPLCVRHNEHVAFCETARRCQVVEIDSTDARCTRALTLWAMARGYPMWTQLDAVDDNPVAFVSLHLHRDDPLLAGRDRFIPMDLDDLAGDVDLRLLDSTGSEVTNTSLKPSHYYISTKAVRRGIYSNHWK